MRECQGLSVSSGTSHKLCVKCLALNSVCVCAAPQGMSSVYFNKGENCIAAGRLFVEESIHDEYISRVVSKPNTRGGGLESHIFGLETCLANIDKRLDLTLTWYS